MKHLRFLLLFILISVNSIYSQNGPLKDKFYMGAFQFSMYAPWFHDYGFSQPHHFDNYRALSYNMMHSYGYIREDDFIESGQTFRFYGGFRDPLSYYSFSMGILDNSWYTNFPNSNSLILERYKLEKAGYGQRSTYQAEYNAAQLTGGSIRPGYGFTSCNGQPYTENWQSETVSGRKMCVNCPGDNPPAGYIVKDLYENREQVNVSGPGKLGNPGNGYEHDLEYNLSDRKDPAYTWYVKPRMRIDQTFANNSSNWETDVVKIEIYNFNGDLITPVRIIKVKNFLDNNQYYDGSYKEIFNFPGEPSYPLSVLASDLLEGTMTDNATALTTNIENSEVDYRVYWYGDVDVWLDYVRLDDEWAHFLFEPDPTPTYDFVNKIQNEVAFFENLNEFGYFYLDEHYYNNYPCIAKVNQLVQAINPNTSMLVLFNTNYLNQGPVFKNPPGEDNYEFLVQSGAVKDIIMPDIYPFESAEGSLLPHNVSWPVTPSTSVYQKANTRDEYNDNIMNVFDNGQWIDPPHTYKTVPYLERYKKCASLTKNHPEIVFHLNTQVHSFPDGLAVHQNAQVAREPTMEEISMQAYLGLCYNARNITQWIYQSGITTNGGTNYFSYGILDTDPANVRSYNYYGQEKWNGLVALNQKIRAMGDYMFTTHNLRWDAGLTVHNETMPFKYIENIKSRATLINGINPCFHDSPPNEYYDCDEKRYWEIGFYNPPSVNDMTKYFLALNKRCTPHNNTASGDFRELQLQFVPAQLPVYNSWKLFNAVTNTVITTFDKNSTNYISAGTFAPGEGILFKLEPVIPKGGTLVADEVISGQSLTCLDTIINNGYNITIDSGSTISFTDSACIIMSGGTFQSGALNEGTAQTIYKGIGTGKWNGLQLNNCAVKIYNSKFQNISSPVINYAVKMLNCPLGDIRTNEFVMSSDTSGAVQ